MIPGTCVAAVTMMAGRMSTPKRAIAADAQRTGGRRSRPASLRYYAPCNRGVVDR